MRVARMTQYAAKATLTNVASCSGLASPELTLVCEFDIER